MFKVGSITGLASRRWYFGADPETVDQNSARRIASTSCVLPDLNFAFAKMGDAVTSEVRLVASIVPPPAKENEIGINSTGTVVVADPAAGFVPTIV